jgi:endogenous inhibitor of DNA gyrase (YacG/DUF329 family)
MRGAGRPGRAKGAAPARKAPRCPICGQPAVAEYRPFCSRRCANIDLGRWLEGRYAVPGEPVGADTAVELGPEDEDAGC